MINGIVTCFRGDSLNQEIIAADDAGHVDLLAGPILLSPNQDL
jgi:hypothetical protein